WRTGAERRFAELPASGAACWCLSRCGRPSAKSSSAAVRRNSSPVFSAWLHSHKLHRGNFGGAVDHQVAVIVDPHLFPRQRLRRRAFNLVAGLVIAFAVHVDLAAMARARNDAELLLPRCHASEVCADGLQRKEAFL